MAEVLMIHDDRKHQAIAAMRMLQQSRDHEAAHSQADDLLCELLRELGCADVVDEYQKITKWCA